MFAPLGRILGGASAAARLTTDRRCGLRRDGRRTSVPVRRSAPRGVREVHSLREAGSIPSDSWAVSRGVGLSSDSEYFDAPRRRRAVRLAREIGAWIAGGGLAESDRLPPIRDLARRFGATRTTIRTALGVLEDQGLLRDCPSGLSVAHADPVSQARETLAVHFRLGGLTVGDIYDLRRLLEPDLAARLAGRLSSEVTDALSEDLRASKGEAPHLLALGFHVRLAREADNPLLASAIGFLADLLTDLPHGECTATAADDAFQRQTHLTHLRLLTALRDGRAADARRTMLNHLESVEHYLEARDSGLLARYVAE